MDEKGPYVAERQGMVREQLIARGVRDSRVIMAMEVIPRHLFVPEEYRFQAYADSPLPIGQGQTISQPYIVALMTQLLQLKGPEKILEVGTGSGYQAAILGYLAREVYSLEQHPVLAERAEEILMQVGIQNVHIYVGDGSQGLADEAPFDAMIATAAAPDVPPQLTEQLADGGRLVLPVGGPEGQILERIVRHGSHLERDPVARVAFVPLRGKFGWREDEW
jgi:protein-L-isoaspartate(D-aspartate) O-methyltransferase